MTTFIANVGNRDIQDENGLIKRCRSVGKEHFEHYDTVQNQLTFPIIQQGLDHILNSYSQVDSLILFYTDQPHDKAKKKWESDTVWFARLLERIIPESYPGKFEKITTIPIRQSPHDYDAMFTFFQQELQNIDPPAEGQSVFLSPAGGTPACNMALIYRGIQLFNGQAKMLLVAENRPVRELNVGQTILGDFQRQLCAGYLENFDFSSLNATIGQLQIGSAIGRGLIRYFHQRLTMNYIAAAETADKLVDKWRKTDTGIQTGFQKTLEAMAMKKQWQTVQDYLQELRDDMAIFQDPPDHPIYYDDSQISALVEKYWQMWLVTSQRRIAELWLNAVIKWETGHYTDFLARLYRINEAILHWIFENETHRSIRKKGYKFIDFEAYLVNEGREFAEFLDHEGIKGNIPDVVKMKKFLTWLVKKQKRDELRDIKRLIDLIGDTNGVLRLRNHSIIAHGFEPVTLDKIKETYQGKDLLDDVRNVLQRLSVKDHTQSVELARDLIRHDLDCPVG